MAETLTVRTDTLEIGYEAAGPGDGPPVILLHGFPDDVRAYDAVVPLLAEAGCRVLVPYLRGCGATRFLDAATPRSGQQAAIGRDLLGFLGALGIGRATLVGYDWGGRAACVVAALHPGRVRAIVPITGYAVQDVAGSATHPAGAEQEYAHWYQWYFHTDRGVAGLAANRRALCRLMWRLWSPHWAFDEATFARTAASWDVPDFVDVVIHSYRHRHGNAPGDPAHAADEAALVRLPPVAAPGIVLHGEADGVTPVAGSAGHARHFTGGYARRVLPMVGHFVPQEAPGAVVEAVRALLATTA